jgi:hypothetical protein
MSKTGDRPKSTGNSVRVIFAIIVEVVIIAVWLIILAPWYSSTQIIADIPPNTGNREEESIQYPPQDEIRQYRMIYTNKDSKELIIDLLEEHRAKFAVVYTGDSNFEMTLLTNEREEHQVIKDQKGPFEFIQEVDVPYTGPYLVRVKTLGDWSIEQR